MEPIILYKMLRLLKLNSFIHYHTSIKWDKYMNEMYIFTDNGRILRPILVLRNRDGKKSNNLIENDLSSATTWNNLFGGYIFEEKGIVNNDNVYYRDEFLDIKKR